MKRILIIGFGLAVSLAFGQFQLGWNTNINGSLHVDCRVIDLEICALHVLKLDSDQDLVEFLEKLH